MHGVYCRAYFVFQAATLALQGVFVFRTDGRTDTMRENYDHLFMAVARWVNYVTMFDQSSTLPFFTGTMPYMKLFHFLCQQNIQGPCCSWLCKLVFFVPRAFLLHRFLLHFDSFSFSFFFQATGCYRETKEKTERGKKKQKKTRGPTLCSHAEGLILKKENCNDAFLSYSQL